MTVVAAFGQRDDDEWTDLEFALTDPNPRAAATMVLESMQHFVGVHSITTELKLSVGL